MSHLPWWDDDTISSLVAPIQKVLSMQDHAFMETFRKRMEIIAVVIANRMEKTVPDAFDDGTTYLIMNQIQNNPDYSPGDISWPAEGGMSIECTRQQLYQHTQALMFVVEQAHSSVLLSPSMICDIHSILMHNSTDESGNPIRWGKYRLLPANDGAGHLYMEPQFIADSMEHLCRRFNEVVQAGGGNMEIYTQCQEIARLMFNFLQIHPFENGNGRTARLLVNYAFLSLGAPFVVPLTNGHRKNRKHYLQCLFNQEKGKDGYVASYLLECYATACRNFEQLVNLQHM